MIYHSWTEKVRIKQNSACYPGDFNQWLIDCIEDEEKTIFLHIVLKDEFYDVMEEESK